MEKAGILNIFSCFGRSVLLSSIGALLVWAALVFGLTLTGHVASVGAQAVCSDTLTFDQCALRVRFRTLAGGTDRLTVACRVLDVSAAASGINPATEDSLFTLNGGAGDCFTSPIDAVTCTQRPRGFLCKSAAGNAPKIRMGLRPRRGNPDEYRLKLKAKEADLQCLRNSASPWIMGLELGDDCGQAACPESFGRRVCASWNCGDGVVASGEQCDDGNVAPGDGCDENCAVETCGNGVAEPGEDCDDGNMVDGDCCSNGCLSTAVCGDGLAECGEECDDGNMVAGDCCDESCDLEGTSGCGHPLCPDMAELRAWAGAGQPCTNDGDCGPGSCNLAMGRCQTATDIDQGANGVAHDSDVNDQVRNRLALRCDGSLGGSGCGQCDVLGVDPSLGNCRCADNRRVICDEPFQPDIDDCGGSTCQCFQAPPLPLAAGGVAVCQVHRFAEDLAGTVDVDTGQFELTTGLRVEVYLGLNIFNPCPTCDGDTVYDDGIRDGTCSGGYSIGQPCDAAGINHTFPLARSRCSVTGDPCGVNGDCPQGTCTEGNIGLSCGHFSDCDTVLNVHDGKCGETCDPYSPTSPGGEYSLDCMPVPGRNISGPGSPVSYTLTADTQTLDANLDCSFPFLGETCHCLQCSGDATFPCSSDADCAAVGAGTCIDSGLAGMATPACSSFATVCTPTGDNEGECPGASEGFCDGLVRANGEGYLRCSPGGICVAGDLGSPCQKDVECDSSLGAGDGSCSDDIDCNSFGAIGAGNCTLGKTRECFLDTIQADGQAVPGAPVGAAVFCIAPVGSAGVNAAFGLPGPGRIKQQLTSTMFCASDPSLVYTPGDPTSCQ